MRQHTPASDATQSSRRGLPWLVAGLALFVGAFAVLWATGNTAVESSADGYGTTPLWALTVPVLVGLVLTRLVPPHVSDEPERGIRAALRGHRLGVESALLLACLAAFILANLALGPSGDPEDPAGLLYPASKVLLFLAVPWLVLRLMRPTPTAETPDLWDIATSTREWWRWGGMVAVVVSLYLSQVSPLASPAPTAESLPPMAVLLVTMVGTFLTASVLEEVFFRVWLQTRLEFLVGRWAGIVLSSLAFGVMHVASHQALGTPALILAQVLAVQGVSGLLYGYLWSRYRNLWVIIILHTGINSLALIPALLSA
ncbi:CPBP family intramembrane metalloprotease [Spiractinospora alimapuensis]|uniref:CPBP family intramembrane glutamic endopeptidase n=1 Tax=Spiractinospora alimapuensis TaxID=2820884 RepID=UPI001F2B219F|nr:CPBP family intramembrane glutamic endopeptidase [Spiractinospora alimapuensis]QVQ51241.1 CPBP family intramembrane metalloprotease [Spiractinospora alimapuensis]